jgi:hypothetical protein
MRFTQSLVVAAATMNLALGAPIKEERSRAIVAKESFKRANANNPYAGALSDDPQHLEGIITPTKIRSLMALLKRTSTENANKRYEYRDTPRSSEEDLAKRYEYRDTPRSSEENLAKRYEYRDTPRSSEEDLAKRYEYRDTPRSSEEDLTKP